MTSWKWRSWWIVALCVLVLPALPSTVGALTPQQARTEPSPPPEAFQRVCVRCHASDRVVSGRRFRSQWEEVLEQMVARGATGSDADFDAVLDYLVDQFGRVNINAAPAAEIAEILHLQPAEAEAIVAHRKKAGRFEDFAALARVPGLPAERLEARRDAIVF